MEELDNLLAESIDKYFTILSRTGYIEQSNVDNLIMLTAIQYILDTFQEYVSNDDIRDIMEVLTCISGNCLIDYPRTLSEDDIIHSIKRPLKVRVSQDNIFRISEDSLFRLNA